MNKYKVQLHCHTKSDPEDWLFHDEIELIDHAHKNNFDVLAITCHNKIVYNDEIDKYAKSKNILLIPGIEKTIQGKHVLIINPEKEAEKIKTFDDLKKYKKEHKECLIIAPHPYHPLPIRIVSLRNKVKKYRDCFDAIEWSSFHTKYFKFNKKAFMKAKEFRMPILATSDNHVLSLLNNSYSYVFAPKKTIPDIISAIKNGKIDIVSKPMNIFRLAGMTLRLTVLEYIKRLIKLFYPMQ